MKPAHALFVLLALLSAGIPLLAAQWPAYPGSPAGPAAFIQAEGNLLRSPDGKEFLIRSVAFGNEVWSRPKTADKITHHNAVDYQRVKAMGFNCVRFYLNYDLFEDDAKPFAYKQSGFDWIDKNVAAAKTQGLYLILNMHVPQGGFQSLGEGKALWSDAQTQKRLVALMTEIARRYKDEETVLGYAPINEPVTLKGVGELKSLDQDLINGIRSVDPKHLIILERVNWVRDAAFFTAEDAANLYFPMGLVDTASPAKPNIVYEFHTYDPLEFSHQNASWIAAYKGAFATWPDESKITAVNPQWAGCSDGKALDSGTTPWTTLTSPIHTVRNPAFKIAYPTLQMANLGAKGEVWLDDIVVEEFNPAGTLVRTLAKDAVDSEGGWNLWAENGVGSGRLAKNVEGSSNNACLSAKGTTKEANYSSSGLKFAVKQNYGYRISGRVKGSNVGSSASVRLRLDFYSSPSISAWNKDMLSSRVGEYSAWAAKNHVPVFCGEFGLYKDAFEADRGGLTWISDMLDILTTQKVSYNYHTWHESSFGLYQSDGELPDPAKANQAAIDLLTKAQTGK